MTLQGRIQVARRAWVAAKVKILEDQEFENKCYSELKNLLALRSEKEEEKINNHEKTS